MKDKPKKFGFLEYAFCTLGGYFLHIVVHHLPGKEKRRQRNLDEGNLDKENVLQLKLQERYGEQGALVMRLENQLSFNGHEIFGDNALSSVQLAIDLKKGNCEHINIKKCDYTGTQVMQKKKGKIFKMNFQEYKNLPTDGWGRIKKYSHEWYCDNDQGISVVKFHDKKHVTLLSTVHHGCEVSFVRRTWSGLKTEFPIPKMVNNYSFKKVGVDVGDQQLRSKLSYADDIRSYAWSRKWGMHAIQQIRHNDFKCWVNLHEIKTGCEPECTMWSDDGFAGGKI